MVAPEFIAGNSALPAHQLLHQHHKDLLERMVRWSALDEEEARAILSKLEDRAKALRLRFPRRQLSQKLMDVAAMAAALAMEFAYTGTLMK